MSENKNNVREKLLTTQADIEAQGYSPEAAEKIYQRMAGEQPNEADEMAENESQLEHTEVLRQAAALLTAKAGQTPEQFLAEQTSARPALVQLPNTGIFVTPEEQAAMAADQLAPLGTPVTQPFTQTSETHEQ